MGAPSLDERAEFTGDPNRPLEVKLMDYQKFKNHGGPSPSKAYPIQSGSHHRIVNPR